MRIRPAFALALPILIGLSGAGLGQEMAAGRTDGTRQPIPETAKGACRTIAAILVVYPVLEVSSSEGMVRDLQDGPDRFGCRIHAVGPASGMTGEVPPDHPLRFLLGEDGWQEEDRYAADGPGTTSFALRKNGILCLFTGGAHSWIENGKIETSETFEFEAGCVEESVERKAAPGR